MPLTTPAPAPAPETLLVASGLTVVCDINALARDGHLDSQGVRRLISLLLMMRLDTTGDPTKINTEARKFENYIGGVI
jgi:hypothetical protein